jgi:sugar/nucleoside kinase (ribokinase family)
MTILVVGSIAFDTVETPHGSLTDAPGGSALFFSASASFFSPVNVVGVVGEDFDSTLIDFLRKRNVNFDGMIFEKGKTFRWGGKYHTDMNIRETRFTHLNVFENFNPVIPDHYKDCACLFLANIDPDLQLQVLDQVKKPQMVIMDTMNFWISNKLKSLEKVIQKCDVLILNDEEARDLTGKQNLISAGKQIIKMGPSHLIIKKGEHGALLLSDDSFFSAPAFPTEKVVDPTGAGDTFAGGTVGFLSQKNNIKRSDLCHAILYGTTLASFNVEDFSFRRLVNLTRGEIDIRYKKILDMITVT